MTWHKGPGPHWVNQPCHPSTWIKGGSLFSPQKHFTLSTVNNLGSQVGGSSRTQWFLTPTTCVLHGLPLSALKAGRDVGVGLFCWGSCQKDHEKTEGRSLGCHRLGWATPTLRKTPTWAWENEESNWRLVVTGNSPPASSFLLHKKLFWEREWRLYAVSSRPQANKHVKWPLRPGSCGLDTEVIQETIRCHLERAGTLKEIASKGQTACFHSQSLTHPYPHWHKGHMEPSQLIHAGSANGQMRRQLMLKLKDQASIHSPPARVDASLDCTFPPKLSLCAINQSLASPSLGFSWF